MVAQWPGPPSSGHWYYSRDQLALIPHPPTPRAVTVTALRPGLPHEVMGRKSCLYGHTFPRAHPSCAWWEGEGLRLKR